MAEYGEIHIKDETRPCFYKGERAMFHRWAEWRQVIAESLMIGGHPAGIIAQTFAIIELEDGTVMEVSPHDIKFADGGGFNDMGVEEVLSNGY